MAARDWTAHGRVVLPRWWADAEAMEDMVLARARTTSDRKALGTRHRVVQVLRVMMLARQEPGAHTEAEVDLAREFTRLWRQARLVGERRPRALPGDELRECQRALQRIDLEREEEGP